MRYWVPWLPVWAGYALLVTQGDLTTSPALDSWNPNIRWSWWFTALLVTAIVHAVTRRRVFARIEMSALILIATLRSAVYIENGFAGPAAVWLLLVGYALAAYLTTPATSEWECRNATTCPRRDWPSDRNRVT